MPHSTVGNYKLVAQLGAGGMAEVFLAVDVASLSLRLTKLMVLKRLREHLASDPEFVAMLVDEARIAARLNHPNIVQTLEMVESEDEHYLVMEYLDGQPLKSVLRHAPTLPQAMHLSVLLDTLAGLHYAHELSDFDGSPLGIVHRDATPHNIFVTYDGRVKLVDFGIAKAVGRSQETRAGVIKGKTPYMAPEQARAARVDRRVDVFAIGVLAWEAATGRRMWQGLHETEILRNLLQGKVPTSPRAVEPSVDPALDVICRRALSVDPADRYPTADAFRQELQTYLNARREVTTPRALGDHLRAVFKDRREHLRQIVEQQLSRIRENGPVSSSPYSYPPVSSRSMGGTAALSSTGSVPSAVAVPVPLTLRPPQGPVSSYPTPGTPTTMTSTGASSHSSRSFVARPEGRNWAAIAAGVVALCASATAVVALSKRNPSEGTTPTAPSASAHEPARRQTVPITVVAAPVNAQVSIDNGPALSNPYYGAVEREAKQHTVHVSAPGYQTKDEVVWFDNEVVLKVTLNRDPKAAGR